MAGFRLGNTLSDNGSVTRGVCHIEEGALTGVTETHNIFKTADGCLLYTSGIERAAYLRALFSGWKNR